MKVEWKDAMMVVGKVGRLVESREEMMDKMKVVAMVDCWAAE